MARLMSQIKGGYYAADPAAVAAVLDRLRPPDAGNCLILDPCAGEGHALLQLAQGLHAVPYGIELSEDRAALVRESLPEGQSLAPADFLRCSISYRSFSFIWCNPPYDYATGREGRVESQFIERAVQLLVDNGVLALVCPHDVADSSRRASSSSSGAATSRRCRYLKRSASSTRPLSSAAGGSSRVPSVTGTVRMTGWKNGWRTGLSTSCRQASNQGIFARRSRPIANWPGWYYRAPCDFISSGRQTN